MLEYFQDNDKGSEFTKSRVDQTVIQQCGKSHFCDTNAHTTTRVTVGHAGNAEITKNDCLLTRTADRAYRVSVYCSRDLVGETNVCFPWIPNEARAYSHKLQFSLLSTQVRAKTSSETCSTWKTGSIGVLDGVLSSYRANMDDINLFGQRSFLSDTFCRFHLRS